MNIYSTCYASLSNTVKNVINTTHVKPWVVFFYSPEEAGGSIFSPVSISNIFSLNKEQLLCLECFECDDPFHPLCRPFTKQTANKIKVFLDPLINENYNLIIACPMGKISSSVSLGINQKYNNCRVMFYGKNTIVKRIQNLMFSEL